MLNSHSRSSSSVTNGAQTRRYSLRPRGVAYGFLTALLGVLTLCTTCIAADPAQAQFPTALYNRSQKTYGEEASLRIQAWQALIKKNQSRSEWHQLHATNNFVNRLNFVDDQKHWGKPDYWATPIEFFATKGGDCEDFTIAKYFTLRALGIPVEKLRLVNVDAKEIKQAHMVLIYLETKDAMPLVLDNINKEILPINKRPDLVQKYSFNSNGLWLAHTHRQGQKISNKPGIAHWAEVLKRMEQGF